MRIEDSGALTPQQLPRLRAFAEQAKKLELEPELEDQVDEFANSVDHADFLAHIYRGRLFREPPKALQQALVDVTRRFTALQSSIHRQRSTGVAEAPQPPRPKPVPRRSMRSAKAVMRDSVAVPVAARPEAPRETETPSLIAAAKSPSPPILAAAERVTAAEAPSASQAAEAQPGVQEKEELPEVRRAIMAAFGAAPA